MLIHDVCTGCGACLPYCPMGAILMRGGLAVIDLEECVECGVCLNGICSVGAIRQDENMSESRMLRSMFSNPRLLHCSTKVLGRGTEEMKTNDVTGYIRCGFCGVAVELGRPGIGTRFVDVEKVAKACAAFCVAFNPGNPVTSLMVDRHAGKLRGDVLGEKVLSAIVEFYCPNSCVVDVLRVLKNIAPSLDTVFSLGVYCRADAHGVFPMYDIVCKAGLFPSVNGKTNIGLGRVCVNV